MLKKKIDITIISLLNSDDYRCYRAYKSLYKQKKVNFEHIIIYSKKCSNFFIKKLKKDFFKSSFHLEKYQKNKFFALNQGLHISNSKNIGVLHCDDYYKDNKLLQKVVSNLQLFDYTFCGVSFYRNNRLFREWFPKNINIFTLNLPPHTGLFHRREILNFHCKYNAKFSISSDFDFLIRLIKVNLNYIIIKNNSIAMDLGGDSTSIKNIIKILLEDYFILKINKFNFIIFYLFIKKFRKIFQYYKIF
jgi:hypothetical protein